MANLISNIVNGAGAFVGLNTDSGYTKGTLAKKYRDEMIKTSVLSFRDLDNMMTGRGSNEPLGNRDVSNFFKSFPRIEESFSDKMNRFGGEEPVNHFSDYTNATLMMKYRNELVKIMPEMGMPPITIEKIENMKFNQKNDKPLSNKKVDAFFKEFPMIEESKYDNDRRNNSEEMEFHVGMNLKGHRNIEGEKFQEIKIKNEASHEKARIKREQEAKLKEQEKETKKETFASSLEQSEHFKNMITKKIGSDTVPLTIQDVDVKSNLIVPLTIQDVDVKSNLIAVELSGGTIHIPDKYAHIAKIYKEAEATNTDLLDKLKKETDPEIKREPVMKPEVKPLRYGK